MTAKHVTAQIMVFVRGQNAFDGTAHAVPITQYKANRMAYFGRKRICRVFRQDVFHGSNRPRRPTGKPFCQCTHPQPLARAGIALRQRRQGNAARIARNVDHFSAAQHKAEHALGRMSHCEIRRHFQHLAKMNWRLSSVRKKGSDHGIPFRQRVI